MKARTITAIGLVIVLVAGSLALILGIPAGLLVGAVSNRLEAAVGYRLDVPGGATLTFWPQLTFLARDVRVSRPGDTGSIDRFTAQSLRLSLKSVSVFSGSTAYHRDCTRTPGLASGAAARARRSARRAAGGRVRRQRGTDGRVADH